MYFVEPHQGNEAALGFDLASNTARLEALNKARDTGNSVATSRITLVQETGDQYGFLVFVPIFRNGEPIATPQQRRDNLTGFALGVFRVGDLVEGASADEAKANSPLKVHISDESAQPQHQLLYPKSIPQREKAAPTSQVEVSQTFHIGGRKWLIKVTPMANASAFLNYAWQAWGALLAGFLITGLGALYLRQVLNRNDAIHALVEQRTAALAKTMDELSLSNRDLEGFAYVASHDLKAPLRNIGDLAEWIEEDLGEELRGGSGENMTLLRGRVKRMENLLDDLLRYARAGKTGGEICPVDVKAIVDDIVGLLQRPDGITVRTVGDLPRFDTAREPLDQVLRNLISNSIKHHDRDNGLIEVSSTEGGECFTFSVSDDGPGIDPDFHEKVFQMFQTLRPRDEVEGSGMGLAMVRKLVERYGGKIQVVSEARVRGAEFKFDWPKEMEMSRSMLKS